MTENGGGAGVGVIKRIPGVLQRKCTTVASGMVIAYVRTYVHGQTDLEMAAGDEWRAVTDWCPDRLLPLGRGIRRATVVAIPEG